MEKLIEFSVVKAKHVYGLVYPRERWHTQVGGILTNTILRLLGGGLPYLCAFQQDCGYRCLSAWLSPQLVQPHLPVPGAYLCA
jgi:hypothetical protein